jgi:hypothetical protein
MDPCQGLYFHTNIPDVNRVSSRSRRSKPSLFPWPRGPITDRLKPSIRGVDVGERVVVDDEVATDLTLTSHFAPTTNVWTAVKFTPPPPSPCERTSRMRRLPTANEPISWQNSKRVNTQHNQRRVPRIAKPKNVTFGRVRYWIGSTGYQGLEPAQQKEPEAAHTQTVSLGRYLAAGLFEVFRKGNQLTAAVVLAPATVQVYPL